MNILFVCTGNTCRSPMAELYLKHLLEQKQKSGLHLVESAGLSVWSPDGISREAEEILSEFGIDSSGFRSRQLTEEIFVRADRIYCMTRNHLECIKKLSSPEEAARLYTLIPGADVSDPFGGSLAQYRDCFNSMQQILQDLADNL